MDSKTPQTLEEFTPEWMTYELRRSAAIGTDTTVTGVECEVLGEGEGFMGIVARLALSYEGPEGPAAIIAKIPTTVDENRATGKAIGVYEREVRIYADVLPTLDLPTPHVYSAIYEATGDEAKQLDAMMKANGLPMFLLKRLTKLAQKKAAEDPYVPPCVLLIEDLSGIGEIGDQVEDASIAKVAAGLAVLAKMHAQTWGSDKNPADHWAKGPQFIPKVIHSLFQNGYENFLSATSHNFSPHTRALLKSCKTNGLSRAKSFYANTPWCLAHGDFRLDNMFFGPDGSVMAIIDWQNAAPGPGTLDVAYFVASSLPEDTEAAAINELLAGYHSELVKNGVTDYSFDRFTADYPVAFVIMLERLQGLTDTEMIDFGDGRGNELVSTWMRRVDACAQHISLDSIGS